MRRWSGDVAKYRGLKGDIGEILHVLIKTVKVGPCEGGSESAMPAWPNKQALSMLLQYMALIIHDVCVYRHTCVSLHGRVCRLHEMSLLMKSMLIINDTAREKHTKRGRLRERKAWKRKLRNDKE